MNRMFRAACLVTTAFTNPVSPSLAAEDSIARGLAAKALATTSVEAAPYLGAVATRGRVAYQSISAAGSTWVMSRSMSWARDNITNPTLLLGNFYVNTNNTEVTIGAGTIKASIEYPAGTFTLCNGGTTAFPNGLTLLPCNGVTIPNGAQFWVRLLQVNSNGVIYSQLSGSADQVMDPSEGFTNGTGTPTDLTTSGTLSGGTYNGFWPLAVLAQTMRPSVLIFGDSRAQCGDDYLTNASADLGNIARGIGPVFGYSNVAISGTLLSGYLASSHAYRDQMVQYFSHIVDEWGVNDLNGGASVATLAANRASFAALYPNNVVIGTTIEPNTSSTDDWTTIANQSAANAKVTAFNMLERAGIAGEQFIFDIADGIDPFRSGQWPMGYNAAATSVAPLASVTASIATTGVMTVTSVGSGSLAIGQPLVIPGLTNGRYISGLISGTGGTGTYQLSQKLVNPIASTTITAGAFATVDGLHASPQMLMLLQERGAINTSLIHRGGGG
jgi:hypothetical protein